MHRNTFLFGNDKNVFPDIRNFMLHAFLLTGMNSGMRYEKMSEVRMEKLGAP